VASRHTKDMIVFTPLSHSFLHHFSHRLERHWTTCFAGTFPLTGEQPEDEKNTRGGRGG